LSEAWFWDFDATFAQPLIFEYIILHTVFLGKGLHHFASTSKRNTQ